MLCFGLLRERIQALQFDTCISRGKLPAHRSTRVIAHGLPLLDLVTERLDRRDVVRQALTDEDAEFNFGDVEPAGVDAACSGSPGDRPGPWPLRVGKPHRRRQANGC